MVMSENYHFCPQTFNLAAKLGLPPSATRPLLFLRRVTQGKIIVFVISNKICSRLLFVKLKPVFSIQVLKHAKTT